MYEETIRKITNCENNIRVVYLDKSFITKTTADTIEIQIKIESAKFEVLTYENIPHFSKEEHFGIAVSSLLLALRKSDPRYSYSYQVVKYKSMEEVMNDLSIIHNEVRSEFFEGIKNIYLNSNISSIKSEVTEDDKKKLFVSIGPLKEKTLPIDSSIKVVLDRKDVCLLKNGTI